MDDDTRSIDSPALSNPGTPLMAQVSNPSTPRNDDVTIPQVVPNSTATSIITITTSANNPPIITVGGGGGNNNNGVGGPPGNLLLQVVPPGGGPGCVPQGSSITQSTAATCVARQPQSKYAQLLAVIEDLGKDIRPTYAGSKSSAERLKRGIVHARILICPEATFKTQFTADTVEWCPIEPYENLLVCGTYELVKGNSGTKDHRVGCIYLLKACRTCQDRISLEVVHQVQGPAVLDTRWCNHKLNHHPILATANADGQQLILYCLQQESDDSKLEMLAQSLGEEDTLALSLDWSTVKHDSDQPFIATGDSKGQASVFCVESDGLTRQQCWKAHDYEAWVVGFDYWTPTIVYSGGDDCLFKGWDLRAPTSSVIFINRHHSMGVTSIQKHPWKPQILLSGSYDERILFWDVRHMKNPTSEVKVDGGVWRLKWMEDDHLLAACMHGGASVIDAKCFNSSKTPQVTLRYTRHASMVYGIDWCRHPQAIWTSSSSYVDQKCVATCSFYDRALHLWNFTASTTDHAQ